MISMAYMVFSMELTKLWCVALRLGYIQGNRCTSPVLHKASKVEVCTRGFVLDLNSI